MILKKELIKLAVEATDSEEALRTVAQGFVDNGYAKDTYPQAIVERERVFATGLPAPAFDIAIPHCDSEHVIKPGNGQLEMLQKLIGVIQDAELLEKIGACKDVDALYELMAPVLG